MKVKIIFCIAAVLCAASASNAQLGTTPRGNVLEYGKPIKEFEKTGYLVQLFDRDGLRYEIFYEDDARAALVRISAVNDGKPAAFPEATVAKILEKNTEQSKWLDKSEGLRNGLKHWDREDGKAFAEYDDVTGTLTMAYKSAVTIRPGVDISNWTPIQLCLSQGLAFPPRQCVYGVKTGFMSGRGRVTGAEGSAILAATPEVYGVKGALVNIGDGSRGAHFGVVNVECDFEGMQAGVVNILSGKNAGTEPPNGFQFGLVNVARDLNGFQFGLVNVVANGPLPFMIIFNFDSTPDESAE